MEYCPIFHERKQPFSCHAPLRRQIRYLLAHRCQADVDLQERPLARPLTELSRLYARISCKMGLGGVEVAIGRSLAPGISCQHG